jgi:hypothetical protein
VEAILPRRAASRVTVKPAPRRLWDKRFAPVGLYLPIVIVAMGAHWLFEDPVITLCVGGAVSMLIHIALGYIEARRANLWLSPLTFYFFFYSINLGLSAIHMGNRIARGEAIGFSVTTLFPDNIAGAYLVYLVGSLALHFGMQVLRPLPGDEPQSTASATAPAAPGGAFLILWILGMGRRFFGDFTSQLGAISGLFNWACLAALSAYALTSDPKRRGATFWILLGAGTMVELVMNLRSGSKAYIMFSFIPLVWLFARERPLRRWLPLVLAGFVVFYLGIVQPVVMYARLAGGSADEGIGDRIARVYLQGSYEDQAAESDAKSDFLDRQFDPTPASFLHREVEREGFKYGATMDYLAYAFIPRIVWPDKPDVTRGAWFTVYLGQARTHRDVTTSTGITAIGELYWNFGYAGVVLGMTLIGLFRGYLWRLCGQHPERHPIQFLLYVSLFFGMIDMPEAGTVLVGCVYQLVVFGSAIWMLDFIQKHRAARAEE